MPRKFADYLPLRHLLARISYVAMSTIGIRSITIFPESFGSNPAFVGLIGWRSRIASCRRSAFSFPSMWFFCCPGVSSRGPHMDGRGSLRLLFVLARTVPLSAATSGCLSAGRRRRWRCDGDRWSDCRGLLVRVLSIVGAACSWKVSAWGTAVWIKPFVIRTRFWHVGWVSLIPSTQGAAGPKWIVDRGPIRIVRSGRHVHWLR